MQSGMWRCFAQWQDVTERMQRIRIVGPRFTALHNQAVLYRFFSWWVHAFQFVHEFRRFVEHPSSSPLSITLSHDEVMHNQCISRWVTKHIETVSFVQSFYNVSSRNHIPLNTEFHRFESTGSVAGGIPFSRSPPIVGSITKFGMHAFDQELISRPKLFESSSAIGLQQLAALAERRLVAAKTTQYVVQLLLTCPRSPRQSQNQSTVFMPE
jgi:hypothetical protein